MIYDFSSREGKERFWELKEKCATDDSASNWELIASDSRVEIKDDDFSEFVFN